jgi:hypothetical protein
MGPLRFAGKKFLARTLRVPRLNVDAATGGVSFPLGDGHVFGVGQGGPQFDRKGQLDRMGSGQGVARIAGVILVEPNLESMARVAERRAEARRQGGSLDLTRWQVTSLIISRTGYWAFLKAASPMVQSLADPRVRLADAVPAAVWI